MRQMRHIPKTGTIGCMATKLSYQANVQFLPTIKAIVGLFDVDMARHSSLLNEKDMLPIFRVGDGSTDMHEGYAKQVMSFWLEGSPFTVDYFCFRKKKGAKWETMLALLHNKIDEYDTRPVIEFVISPSGTISREVAGEVFPCNMEDGGMKLSIIKYLSEADGFVSTAQLKKFAGSKSDESILKQVGKINATLKHDLHLPASLKFIETKRGSGHCINPAYNVIFLKKD